MNNNWHIYHTIEITFHWKDRIRILLGSKVTTTTKIQTTDPAIDVLKTATDIYIEPLRKMPVTHEHPPMKPINKNATYP